MFRSRKKHLAFETLENRLQMASDFIFGLHLETLDTQDRTVSRINIGDAFKLRLSAAELNPVLSLDQGVGGYIGLTFDANLADKNGELNFPSTYSLYRRFDVIAPGCGKRWGHFPIYSILSLQLRLVPASSGKFP